MADEVEMTPVAAAEPPKADPLAKPASTKVATIKLNPVARKPVIGGNSTVSLKPGLKLPPKTGTTTALKPGLKLPPKVGGTAVLKPGLKLPTKPMIRKPGATVIAKPIPKPIDLSAPKPAVPVEAPKPTEAAAPVEPVTVVAPATAVADIPAAAVEPVKPVVEPVAPVVEAVAPSVVEPVKPAEPAATELPKVEPVAAPRPMVVDMPKPVAVDAQGVGKLPTVEAKAIARGDEISQPVVEPPKPMAALKSVTQKLKEITQPIPQQAILRKTGIIAEGAMSESQKEAAKHKTARISLSDAMGVAPVKHENAPMKTIRIKRPVDIPNATRPLMPQPSPTATAPAVAEEVAPEVAAPTATATTTSTITQRKTLKITRPSGGMVRPAGKFGVKRPSQATTVVKQAVSAPTAEAEPVASPVEGAVPEISDIPDMAVTPATTVAAAPVVSSDGPAWLWAISALVQAAACVAIGALAWFLYQNTQIAYF